MQQLLLLLVLAGMGAAVPSPSRSAKEEAQKRFVDRHMKTHSKRKMSGDSASCVSVSDDCGPGLTCECGCNECLED